MGIELGPVFAILTAVFFAISQILVRRATYQAEESFTSVAVSLLVGVPIFLILVTVFGEWEEFSSFSWKQYVLLGSAGLIHLIIARYLFFTGTRIIGANPTVAITRASIIFSLILGVFLLGESITTLQIFAALLIMFGAILTTTEISRTTFRISTQGLIMGLGTALCSAGSATLIRPVMKVTDAVFAATCIMYLTGFFVVMVILLVRRQPRTHFLRQNRATLSLLSSAAIFLVVGHLCRFSALQYSPVSIVQPLVATIVIFTLLFSWMINRRIDVFNWRVVTGIVMVLAGVFLIYD
jgi:drug/metabolite transporter (DMT)-like permease